MEWNQQLNILGEAARYDVSCSSSGVSRPGTMASGICHTWTDDGRCLSLFKVLQTNQCDYDCLYCANRRGNDVPRTTLEPAQLASWTMEFYRRNFIEGLFLSSAVSGGPDRSMERINETLRLLRSAHGFTGYIHAKIIPGASEDLVAETGRLADRISVNIEQCSERSLKLLAPQKAARSIALPMRFMAERHRERPKEFAPAGQSTQVIVGATPEPDRQILGMAQRLYEGYGLRRVYYSAYMPVNDHPALPSTVTAPPLLREHRLYQADWLMRMYGFRAEEILEDATPDLDLELDPKCDWALRHPEFFPVDINRASLNGLLRVPGIGPVSARRIVRARRMGQVRFEHLRAMGVVTRRAEYFICGVGRRTGWGPDRLFGDGDGRLLRGVLSDRAGRARVAPRQMTLEEVPRVAVV